ncbi:MAG: glycosyltransferase family 92 protein [Candidatus Gastranaerophilaceae bacterium]|jgi:hypothetical protein
MNYQELLKYLQNKKIQKHINKLAQKYKNKKVLIYGVGLFFDVLHENFDLSNLNIVAISDKRFEQDIDYKGLKAVTPEDIKKLTFDVMFIAALLPETIEKYAKKNLYPECGEFEIYYLADNDYKEIFEEKNFPHYLSLCAVIKNEAPYLREWIEYHRMIGVEQFYIYNNNSTDNTEEILEPYIKENIVKYRIWQDHPAQIAVYNDCLRSDQNKSFWIGFIDIDEFIVSVKNKNLPEILKDFEEYGGLGINWIIYGSSGHKTAPDGLTLENYVYRSFDDFSQNLHIKTIVNPRKVRFCDNPHYLEYQKPYYAVTENKETIKGPFSDYNSVNIIRVNHYLTRSEEEFIKKAQRGRSDHMSLIRPFDDFEIHNRNEIHDTIMQPFIPKLKAILDKKVINKRKL